MLLTDVSELTKGSLVSVLIQCDINISKNCQKQFTRHYRDYLKYRKDKLDSCYCCSQTNRPSRKVNNVNCSFCQKSIHIKPSKIKEINWCSRECFKKLREPNKQTKQERYEKFKLRKKNNFLINLKASVRRRVALALESKKFKKKSKIADILGCNISQLKEHLEKLFKPGMTWENRGFYGWHIDHIIPLASAKTEDEMLKLCHYTNLQPLWAKENRIKGCKLG